MAPPQQSKACGPCHDDVLDDEVEVQRRAHDEAMTKEITNFRRNYLFQCQPPINEELNQTIDHHN